MTLHVFSNGAHYAIAKSAEEATKMVPTWIEDDMPMIQDPDDKEFPVYYDEDENRVLEHYGGKLVTKTMAEWVELLGKGYFAITEF